MSSIEAANSPSIADVMSAGDKFRSELTAIKAKAAPLDFPWYPYDSLSNFNLLDKLLKDPYRDLGELAGGQRVLDIGCADGATSFLLESAGFEVDAVDYPPDQL